MEHLAADTKAKLIFTAKPQNATAASHGMKKRGFAPTATAR